MNKFDTKRNGVEVKIVETGEIFNSIQACADYLDVDSKWIGQITRGERGHVTCHGYHVVRTDGLGPDIDLNKTEYRGRPGVRVRIIETGEEFESITKCAKHINGRPQPICDILRNRSKHNTYLGFHFEFIK